MLEFIFKKYSTMNCINWIFLWVVSFIIVKYHTNFQYKGYIIFQKMSLILNLHFDYHRKSVIVF